MSSNFNRLRRGVSLCSSLFHRSLHQPIPLSSHQNLFRTISAAAATGISTTAFPQSARAFTSTTALFLSDNRKPFNPETDEIGPDTILFEGCDYNHWLITVDFPKDNELTREQKIEFYVNIAAQVFGSMEEAKKRIYALSTTTYEGFQVECPEETSKKFESIPGVVFVLPDSYIDPVNKEYGGDKYVNGEIFPRPPPVHYGRRYNRDRRPRDQMPYQQGNTHYSNQGPSNSDARNYGQNFGPPPHQQGYGPPPHQQGYGPPPHQQGYGPPPQQQKYGHPIPQQGYGHPPQQGYGPPEQQNYRHPPIPHQQNYSPSGPQETGGPTMTSNALGGGERSPIPSYKENLNRGEFGNYNTQGQRSHAPPERRGFAQDTNSLQGRSFGQGSGGIQDSSTRINVGQNQPKQGEEPRNFSYTANN